MESVRSPVKEVDINLVHSAIGHAHISLLKATEKSIKVKLTGTLCG